MILGEGSFSDVFALTRRSGRRKGRRVGQAVCYGSIDELIHLPTTLLSAADTGPCRGDERTPAVNQRGSVETAYVFPGLDVKNAHAARQIRSADPALWTRSSLISFLS